jgi:glycyl-tRNA synthetase beta chain
MRSPADYADSLAKGRVVPNAALREERIAALLADAARDAGGTLVPDAALVEEVACLVETPHALTGSFDDEFLRLPEIVIRTAMRSHQRYFVVAGPDGKLLPRFLCVLNGEPGDPAQVRDGNERVLRARLDDARFYWTEDRRTTLEEKVPRLADIVWLRGFGSLGDKTDRVRKLAVSIASAHFPDAEQTTDRAALLSKTDLTTEMIRDGKEFTALQGTIGKEYARACGEPDEVAAAIEEQYFPRHAGDGLPASPAGAAIALADRIDTLVGVWGAGLKPTGSKDPHGLRRGAIGVIRILLDRNLAERVGSLIRAAADLYGGLLADPDTVVAEASAFVRDRLAGHLAEEGFDADVAAAVVASSGGNPVDARARTEALTAMRRTSRDDFEALAAGFKRARNILKKESAEGAPERDLLTEDAETALFDAFAAVDAEVGRAEEECRYAEALAGLASLRGPIDHFFDSVMVLTDDDAVRRNRLRLLGRIADRFAGLADLSRISPPERGAA